MSSNLNMSMLVFRDFASQTLHVACGEYILFASSVMYRVLQ